jgi:hypothetical protein
MLLFEFTVIMVLAIMHKSNVLLSDLRVRFTNISFMNEFRSGERDELVSGDNMIQFDGQRMEQ